MNDHSLCIWQLNCRKSSAVIDILLQDAMNKQVVALLLQDPPDTIRKGRRFRGYTVFTSSPNEDAECCILIPSNIVHHPVVSNSNRWQGIEIKTTQGSILLINAYIRHTSGEGLAALAEALPLLMSQYSHVLLAADSNGHHPAWGPPNEASNIIGREFHELLLYHGLSPANQWPSLPTYTHPSGAPHWIDVTATNLQNCVVDWCVVEMTGTLTDHNLLQTKLNLTPAQKLAQSFKDWKHTDWIKMEAFVTQKLADPNAAPNINEILEDQVSLDNFSSSLQGILSKAVEKHVPEKRRSAFSQPWWTQEISLARQDARQTSRAERRYYRQHGVPAPASTITKAREARHKLKNLIIKAKKDSWRTMIDSHSPKSFWDAFKKVSRPYNPISLDYVENMEGTMVTDASTISSQMATKFFPTFPTDFTESQEALNQEVKNWKANSEQLDFPDITSLEVTEVVRNGYHCGAPGIDNVPLLVIHNLLHVLMPFLLILFNSCLQLSALPTDWKLAKVIPVPKKFQHDQKLCNFRPISLIVSLSKVLEKIVQKRLLFWAESSNILHKWQCGFRPMYSTETCLTDLVSTLHNALNSGQFSIGISLDISAAFDTLWPEQLITRLRDYNAPIYLTRWVSDFVSKRRGILQIQQDSFVHEIHSGVPQGSPLSPLLFVLYMQDLFLQPGIDCLRSYADDLFLYSVGSFQEAQLALQPRLNIIAEWCHAARLQLSRTKCQAIVFHTTQTRSTTLTIDNHPLSTTTNLKLLGVWLDNRLNFSHHVEHALIKAMERYRIISKFSGRLWGFRPKILFHLFQACVLPCLYYGCGIWGPFISTKLYKKLDQFTRHCLLAVTGCIQTTSYSSLYLLTGCFSANLLIERYSFRSYLRLLSSNHGESWLDFTTRSNIVTSNITRQLRFVSYRVCSHLQGRQIGIPLEKRVIFSCPPWEDAFTHRLYSSWRECPPSNPELRIELNVAGIPLLHRGGLAWTLKWGSTFKQGSYAGPGYFDEFGLTSSALGLALAATIALLCRARDSAKFTIWISSSCEEIPQKLSKQKNISSTTQEVQRLLRIVSSHTLCFISSNRTASLRMCKDLASIAAHSLSSWPQSSVPWSHRRVLQIHDGSLISAMEEHIDSLGTGLLTRNMVPKFQIGRLWSKDLARIPATVANQLISGHFPSKCYLRRFRVDPLPENTSCLCGHEIEDSFHLLFHCPLTRQFRASIMTAAKIESSSELSWEVVGCFPNIVAEMCSHIKRLWKAQGRAWGRT